MQSTSTARRALSGLGLGLRRFVELAATPLLPADYLDLINPMRAGADLRGRVLGVAHETATSTSVAIQPGKGWRGHRPGPVHADRDRRERGAPLARVLDHEPER